MSYVEVCCWGYHLKKRTEGPILRVISLQEETWEWTWTDILNKDMIWMVDHTQFIRVCMYIYIYMCMQGTYKLI